jgi:hypothetical protein
MSYFIRLVLLTPFAQDRSFTCTLFAPTAELDRLNSSDKILSWFKLNFPDATHAIGEKTLLKDFLQNPRSPLICTKVKKKFNQISKVLFSALLNCFISRTRITIRTG